MPGHLRNSGPSGLRRSQWDPRRGRQTEGVGGQVRVAKDAALRTAKLGHDEESVTREVAEVIWRSPSAVRGAGIRRPHRMAISCGPDSRLPMREPDRGLRGYVFR